MDWIDVGLWVLAIVFFLTSRDNLKKYYQRGEKLLGTVRKPVPPRAFLNVKNRGLQSPTNAWTSVSELDRMDVVQKSTKENIRESMA